MTVFNEAKFLDVSIKSVINACDQLVIVEGSYLESQAVGAPARSNDGTLEVIENWRSNPKVTIILANEKSDKDQRNIGLAEIRKTNKDGWLWIVDGDEVYHKKDVLLVQKLCKGQNINNGDYAYFKSITFVNDMHHYTIQHFPRLFKLRNTIQQDVFVNDNQLFGVRELIPNSISFNHYSFCKGKERFELKQLWWDTRFSNNNFKYDWKIENDKIIPEKHQIYFDQNIKHPEAFDE